MPSDGDAKNEFAGAVTIASTSGVHTAGASNRAVGVAESELAAEAEDSEIAVAATIAPTPEPTPVPTGGPRSAIARRGAGATAGVPRIGERLGERYEIKAFLGEGGMGAVYLAFDEKLGEDVALKVVRGATAAGEMLREEVRVAQKVTHVNVCRVYDLEEIGGDFLIKMEYVGGETLAARLKREGRLPVAEAVRIARGILDALGASHAQRIVHRDLKPGNVMLSKERVVLMDFGLARHVTTKITAVAGTPGYMSPEQLAGADLDARSDLYALGCLTYEMLAGEQVFQATTRAELDKDHKATPPPSLRTRRPDTPRWLARAVDQLLSKDPALRPAGARALQGAKRRLVWVGLAAVAVVVAVVVTVLGRPSAKPGWEGTIEPVRWPYEDRDSPASVSSDGTRIAFSTSEKLFVMPTHGEGSATPIADEVAGYARPRWSRDDKTILISRKGKLARVTVATHAVEELGDEPSQFDDCGDKRLVAEFALTAVKFVFEPGHDVIYTSPCPTYMFAQEPHCDAATGRVVFVMGPSLPSACVDDIWVVAHGEPARPITTSHDVCGATFTPGARSVVYSAKRNGKINLYERALEGGQEHALTTGPGPDTEPDVSADGSTLAFANRSSSSTLTVFDGKRVRRIAVKVGVVDSLNATRDFKYLVAQRNDPYENGELIEVIDLATEQERVLGHGILAFPAFDGQHVYFRTADQEHGRELHAVSVEGAPGETVVAKFPGQIVGGYGARDGVHVAIQRDDLSFEGWRIDEHGQPVSEGVGGLVLPAPSGGWRAIQVPEEASRLDFVPPGNPLTKPVGSVRVLSGFPQWLDDTHFGGVFEGGMGVVDMTHIGDEDAIADVPNAPTDLGLIPLAIVGANSRWATLTSGGNAKHQLLTNFGARPWR